MGDGSKNPLKAIKNDVLRAVWVTLAVAFATGLAGAIMSGAWRKGLLAACGLAIVVLGIILVAAAAWHDNELEEVKFEEMRSQDIEKRGVTTYERAQREHVIRASRHHRDEAGRKADLRAMIERGRRHMSKSRAGSMELLLVDEDGPESPRPIAQAGRFDQDEISTPNRLLGWIDSLGNCAYPCPVPVAGGHWRIFGIRDAEIDNQDRADIQRLASLVTFLDLAHQKGNANSMEESA